MIALHTPRALYHLRKPIKLHLNFDSGNHRLERSHALFLKIN